MIRADLELLAELARLNSDVVPLAMRMMEQSATTDEQHAFAERLIAMARKLQARASGVVTWQPSRQRDAPRGAVITVGKVRPG